MESSEFMNKCTEYLCSIWAKAFDCRYTERELRGKFRSVQTDIYEQGDFLYKLTESRTGYETDGTYKTVEIKLCVSMYGGNWIPLAHWKEGKYYNLKLFRATKIRLDDPVKDIQKCIDALMLKELPHGWGWKVEDHEGRVHIGLTDGCKEILGKTAGAFGTLKIAFLLNGNGNMEVYLQPGIHSVITPFGLLPVKPVWKV